MKKIAYIVSYPDSTGNKPKTVVTLSYGDAIKYVTTLPLETPVNIISVDLFEFCDE